MNKRLLQMEGAKFITSKNANKVNFNYVVARLDLCSRRHNSCIACPDLKECCDAFDLRCSLGDVLCPKCKAEIPKTKYCSECGNPLTIIKRKGGATYGNAQENVAPLIPGRPQGSKACRGSRQYWQTAEEPSNRNPGIRTGQPSSSDPG